MSLQFLGYSATIQHMGRTIGYGVSRSGPDCSPYKAVQAAINDTRVKDLFANAGESWQKTVDLRVTVSIDTGMP
jgi:hypothetical protein